MSFNFQISGLYSFSVYPVAVLGTAFKNVKVLAIVDHDTAQAAGFDTIAMHALVQPTLPDPKPADATKYNYIKIKTPSGTTQYLGIPWIIENTIESVNLGKFTIEIDDESSTSQSKILECLQANGFKVTAINFNAASQ